MSLTSYRAAPPRVMCVSGPRIAGASGVPFDRPLGSLAGSRGSYEPDEVTLLLHPALCVYLGPGWSLPRIAVSGLAVWGGLAGPGGDLLFHALRRSTIGAEGFHGRVRDGIGCFAPRYGHQAVQALRVRRQRSEGRGQKAEVRSQRSEGRYRKLAVSFPISDLRPLLSEASCACVFR